MLNTLKKLDEKLKVKIWTVKTFGSGHCHFCRFKDPTLEDPLTVRCYGIQAGVTHVRGDLQGETPAPANPINKKHPIDEEDDMDLSTNNHRSFRMGPHEFCGDCGIVIVTNTRTLPCPPWGVAAGGGTTPIPGGLDRLGVVKELRDIQSIIPEIYERVELKRLEGALSSLRYIDMCIARLISRLDGQGAEKPAASEPEGQCGEDNTGRCACSCGCLRDAKMAESFCGMCYIGDHCDVSAML